MKRALSLVFFLAVLFLPVTASAAGMQAQLSGPDTVRAGDTITLTFSLNGSGIYGVSGALSYDSSQVTLTGTGQLISGDWQVEFHENSFLAYDNTLAAPINGSAQLFSVTFQVSGSLAPGTVVSISCAGVTASDGLSDADCGTVSYNTVLAEVPGQQEQPPVESTPTVSQTAETPPTAVPAAPTEPETEPAEPAETAPTTAASTEPVESEETRESSGFPVGVLILTAVVCLGAGACVGIVLDQKILSKK